ncbi:hypothetical protein [Ulvibacterium sp.]|uniref:hypothetical protein n=1 Tax=Ulvibacterium sp. TaxID=2665914 RepID=UPI003CC62515
MDVIKSFIGCAVVLLLSSCFLVTGKDEKLTMDRVPNDSRKLRLDGYFIRPSCDSKKQDCIYNLFFLFRNGILFTTGVVAFDKKQLDKIRDSTLSKEFISRNANVKFNWGVYQIEGNNIVFEKWYHSGKNYTYVKSGLVLNDTTFVILSSKRSHWPEEGSEEVKETYHFVEFHNKPDSTTVFIE